MIGISNLQQLGSAVRAARKHQGLKQAQLALASGVGVRFIVELEAGKETLQLGKALRVIHSLGGSIAISGMVTGVDANGE